MKSTGFVALLAAAASTYAAASAFAGCDDRCLTKITDSYLQQLARHDPSSLRLAADLNARENGNAVTLGEGSWKSVSKVYQGQTFTDPKSGEAVRIAATQVDDKVGSMFLRLKIVDGKIAESEMLTKGGEPGFKDDASGMLEPDILYEAVVPSARRSTRTELADIVNHYMDAVGKHDGKLARFSYRCDRYSAGSKFTNTGRPPEQGGGSCETSLNNLKGQEVVNRRIALIDPERGVVAALFIIPHGERTPPTATNAAEIFKIVDGKIRSIEEFSFPGKYPPTSGFAD